MKNIELLISGLFLAVTLLWARGAAQRCLDSDFREWRSRFSRKDVSNTNGNRLLDSD